MEWSELEPALDPEVVEFIHGGVAVGVATRDDASEVVVLLTPEDIDAAAKLSVDYQSPGS